MPKWGVTWTVWWFKWGLVKNNGGCVFETGLRPQCTLWSHNQTERLAMIIYFKLTVQWIKINFRRLWPVLTVHSKDFAHIDPKFLVCKVLLGFTICWYTVKSKVLKFLHFKVKKLDYQNCFRCTYFLNAIFFLVIIAFSSIFVILV